jgi:hypothetical protein
MHASRLADPWSALQLPSGPSCPLKNALSLKSFNGDGKPANPETEKFPKRCIE